VNVPRFDVLGVKIHALDLERATQIVITHSQTPPPGYVCVTGVHGVIESQDDPELKRIHHDAFLVTPDGMPLVWLGPPQTGRVYGPDLMLAVCERGREAGIRHYFLGGGPGVAETLAERLQQRFPGLQVVGRFTPPFREMTETEVDDLRADVARAAPHLIWVGLSTPKQERFMARHWPHLAAGLMIGVGAAFDFHAGLKPQAPRWMQRSGLEWFYRLLQEPARLGPRYLKNNPRFLWLLLKQKLGRR